jgi:hypothetical protein
MSQHQDLIKRDLTVRSVAVLLATVATLSRLASPVARAFEAPDAVVVARAALVVAVTSRVKRTSINHGRLCSWHETSSKASQDSAPFGKSGFCHWMPASAPPALASGPSSMLTRSTGGS